jgi:hypothetical protein
MKKFFCITRLRGDQAAVAQPVPSFLRSLQKRFKLGGVEGVREENFKPKQPRARKIRQDNSHTKPPSCSTIMYVSSHHPAQAQHGKRYNRKISPYGSTRAQFMSKTTATATKSSMILQTKNSQQIELNTMLRSH